MTICENDEARQRPPENLYVNASESVSPMLLYSCIRRRHKGRQNSIHRKRRLTYLPAPQDSKLWLCIEPLSVSYFRREQPAVLGPGVHMQREKKKSSSKSKVQQRSTRRSRSLQRAFEKLPLYRSTTGYSPAFVAAASEIRAHPSRSHHDVYFLILILILPHSGNAVFVHSSSCGVKRKFSRRSSVVAPLSTPPTTTDLSTTITQGADFALPIPNTTACFLTYTCLRLNLGNTSVGMGRRGGRWDI